MSKRAYSLSLLRPSIENGKYSTLTWARQVSESICFLPSNHRDATIDSSIVHSVMTWNDSSVRNADVQEEKSINGEK